MTTMNSFPRGWTYYRELLSNEQYVDPSFIKYEQIWYLFVTVNHNLNLYYSYSLTGPWFHHPKSPIVEQNGKMERSAGRPFIDLDGRLIRPAQDLSQRYGGGVNLIHITKLDIRNYEEVWIGPVLSLRTTNWITKHFHHLDVQIGKSSQTLLVSFDGY